MPDAILAKPGPLDPEEWDFVRQHTILGDRILSAAPALRPVARIVRASHERWDGTGYPDALRGEQIPLARADRRGLRRVRGDHQRSLLPCGAHECDARKELSSQSGRQFDPAVIAAFFEELDDPTLSTVAGGQAEAEDQRRDLAATVVAQVDELLARAA